MIADIEKLFFENYETNEIRNQTKREKMKGMEIIFNKLFKIICENLRNLRTENQRNLRTSIQIN
jgi:hypothetical protein